MHPRLSSDGRQIQTWFRTADPDVWLMDVATQALTRTATGSARAARCSAPTAGA